MSSRSGNWMVAAGALFLFLGLCVLAAALGKNADPDQLIAGAGSFSVGALTVAAGIYLKARTLQSGAASPASVKEPASKRSRGGCELCATEAPVIQCKVHQLHLCGNCLAQHYDFRSCAYVPSTRAGDKKAGKGMAAKARA
jgi:hypothetical protein